MYITKNYMTNGGSKWVIGGELELKEGAVISGEGAADLAAAATETVLGGVKAATAGAGDTVEVKIDETTKKLFVPAYPEDYTLPDAAAEVPGGVLLAANVATPAADATAEAVRTALIATLTALKAAGIMAGDE